jgi:hypothetical protein
MFVKKGLGLDTPLPNLTGLHGFCDQTVAQREIENHKNMQTPQIFGAASRSM